MLFLNTPFELLHEKKKNTTMFVTYLRGLFVTGASISHANHIRCKNSIGLRLKACHRKEEASPIWGHCSLSQRNRNINTVANSVSI